MAGGPGGDARGAQGRGPGAGRAGSPAARGRQAGGGAGRGPRRAGRGRGGRSSAPESARPRRRDGRAGRRAGPPGTRQRQSRAAQVSARSLWPPDQDNVRVKVAPGREVNLTNLRKPFWPDLGVTKGDLLQHYVTMAPVLLPHLRDRAMVMKRYPHGAYGEFFFMKRAPSPRPSWIEICRIEHDSGNVIDFPMIQDLAALLWVINLGCIDLNPWYARCDDVDRPDFLHFDLDPVAGTRLRQGPRDGAGAARGPGRAGHAQLSEDHRIQGHPRLRADRARPDAEAGLGVRQGAGQHPGGQAARPDHRRVQGVQAPQGTCAGGLQPERLGANAGLDLQRASARRARPSRCRSPGRSCEDGVEIEDFRIDNAPARIAEHGDLWAPVLATRGRFKLEKLLGAVGADAGGSPRRPGAGDSRGPSPSEKNV